jgi:hypothetical protein
MQRVELRHMLLRPHMLLWEQQLWEQQHMLLWEQQYMSAACSHMLLRAQCSVSNCLPHMLLRAQCSVSNCSTPTAAAGGPAGASS